MKPDKVDRFVAKRKEREAYLAAAEDDQLGLNIQEPNKCSEDISQPSQISSNQEILNSMMKVWESSKKQNVDTEDADNIEVNAFSNNLMGLFKTNHNETIETNHNETIVSDNQDNLTYIVDVQNEETDPAANYEQDTFSIMSGTFRNIQDNKNERTIFQKIKPSQHNTGTCSHLQR